MKLKLTSKYILDHFKVNINIYCCISKSTAKSSLKASSVILNLLIVQILGEIRPYLTGTGGGILEILEINDYGVIVHVKF